MRDNACETQLEVAPTLAVLQRPDADSEQIEAPACGKGGWP